MRRRHLYYLVTSAEMDNAFHVSHFTTANGIRIRTFTFADFDTWAQLNIYTTNTTNKYIAKILLYINIK